MSTKKKNCGKKNKTQFLENEIINDTHTQTHTQIIITF